jgi:hypothetical protein
MASWKELLNELDRDAAKEQPEDVVQWGADWFQARLRKDVSQVMVNLAYAHRDTDTLRYRLF